MESCSFKLEWSNSLDYTYIKIIMKQSLYLKIIFCIILSLTLSGCGENNCYCVETTTRFQPYRVTVEEYWASDCDYPFTSVQTYWWGNTLTDCR